MDVSAIFKIAGVGILTAVVNIILDKTDKKEMSTLVTLTGVMIALFFVVDMISDLFSTLKNVFSFY